MLLELRQGSESAFRSLYDRTNRHLLYIILRVVADRFSAEDVLQESYVLAWKRSHQFDPVRGTGIQWLTTIARNQAITHLRSRAAQPRLQSPRHVDDGEDFFDSFASTDPGPADLYAAARLEELVSGCLRELGKDQRASVTMWLYEDLTHEEIAARLQRPLGTVKSWLRRSMAFMRSVIGPH